MKVRVELRCPGTLPAALVISPVRALVDGPCDGAVFEHSVDGSGNDILKCVRCGRKNAVLELNEAMIEEVEA